MMSNSKPSDKTDGSTNTQQPPERRRYSKDHFERYAEARLKLDYAILRLPRNEIAFKTRDQDPRVWFTAKHIPERAQVALHLRVPVRDEWNQLDEFIDLDIYFPKDQLAEMMKVLTQPVKNERVAKLQFQIITLQRLEHAFREYSARRSPRPGSVRVRRGKTRRG